MGEEKEVETFEKNGKLELPKGLKRELLLEVLDQVAEAKDLYKRNRELMEMNARGMGYKHANATMRALAEWGAGLRHLCDLTGLKEECTLAVKGETSGIPGLMLVREVVQLTGVNPDSGADSGGGAESGGSDIQSATSKSVPEEAESGTA